MSDTLGTSQPAQTGSYTSDQWSAAVRVLGDLLQSGKGSVSSVALARELKKRQVIADPRPIIVGFTYADAEDLQSRGFEVPQFSFRHLGRSFYTEDRYAEAAQEVEEETEREAEDASRSAAETSAEDEEQIPASRVNRQEEARLVPYVKHALEELYESDDMPENAEFVFDVHSERPGSVFENVDILAVHWRSAGVVDLVTVEVKLDFNPLVVHQALHYQRFSNRVWIAVPVSSDASRAAKQLRDFNARLFELVVASGIGILACRRRQGRSYDVFPVHWPRWNAPDPLEREQFIERSRAHLELAEVVERQRKAKLPILK